jgi:pyruvate ferredoxin oxidoreductase gamma subunit
MFQVRIHGRGGQGVVTAAELLSVAAFTEGRYAQAFPSFGSERMGAPVVSFCRISDAPIRTHEPVSEPDALIIQDLTLLHQPGLLDGLSPGGYMLVNSTREPGDLGLDDYLARLPAGHLLVVPATQLAREHLGRPLPGAPLLGGFAALTEQVRLESVVAAITERFSGAVAEGNATGAAAAYRFVEEERRTAGPYAGTEKG